MSLEHPPVIMVTGYGDEETAARSFQVPGRRLCGQGLHLPTMLTEAIEKALADISLKRVEEELLDEKAFMEEALNCLPDIFAVLEIEGKLFRWNLRLNKVTGYSDTELASMNSYWTCSRRRAPKHSPRAWSG